MDNSGSPRNPPRPVISSTAYRIRTTELQIPCLLGVVDHFFGRVGKPIFEMLQQDHSQFSPRVAEFIVTIPQAQGIDQFVVEASPFIEGIWLGNDNDHNLRCAEDQWRERPASQYFHRLEPEEPFDRLFPPSLVAHYISLEKK